ncbi:hypothetical protein CCYN49044_90004 [Capnocytophaga cynodegmi]|uniref:Uncharacterized protein n=1 Tax=Capnocytophaga cynodegmi TaxID=28189 RepID=A0A0B7HSM5_9FLAO|nr:hypothetical protein CCYN74_20032 [Capnocytophaga cynodegmi]CEN42280.1 hypothetical protein CCYN49044_90004 [Capnocytophaga cynodegmi]
MRTGNTYKYYPIQPEENDFIYLIFSVLLLKQHIKIELF